MNLLELSDSEFAASFLLQTLQLKLTIIFKKVYVGYLVGIASQCY